MFNARVIFTCWKTICFPAVANLKLMYAIVMGVKLDVNADMY